MNPKICFYFQVHQPYRLRDLRIAELEQGGDVDYFDHDKNRQVFRKVAEKCYLPANRLMLDLIRRFPDFRISYSLSGVFLDQCKEYGTDVLDSFRALAETGNVEFLSETYYHSLSSILSTEEFCAQINGHAAAIKKYFGQTPTVFRNTELIYSNELAETVRSLGFKGMLAEGVDWILRGRSPNQPFTPPKVLLDEAKWETTQKYRFLEKNDQPMQILLKNYRLSDDVAFRFSDKNWMGFPLHADTFTDWLTQGGGHVVNLFMDYETFGEHQWADTGIFDFLAALPALWQERGIETVTPSQAIASWNAEWSDTYDVHQPISWADTERDLSAWKSNRIQNAALENIYKLEHDIKETEDEELLETWRKLQTSDHFYYMCTKYWHDGDVHKYFSPYDSPYEAYRRYSHALWHLTKRLEDINKQETDPAKMSLMQKFLDLFDFLYTENAS